jgi:hypothetical protein
MRVLLKDLRVPRKQVIRCDHEPHITQGSNAFNFRTKVPVAGHHNIVSAALKTLFQHSEHCSTFCGKSGIMSRGIFSEQDVHPSSLGALRKLPYPIGELFEESSSTVNAHETPDPADQ